MLQEIMCVSSLKEVYTAELEGRGVDESNSGALRVVRTKLGWKLPEPRVGRRTGSVCVSRKERQVSHTSRTTHCPIQFIKNRCLFFFGYKSARACHIQHTRCSRRCCSPTCTVFSRIAKSRPATGVCRQCRLCRENTNTWNLEQTKLFLSLQCHQLLYGAWEGCGKQSPREQKQVHVPFSLANQLGASLLGLLSPWWIVIFFTCMQIVTKCFFRSTFELSRPESFFFRIDNLRNEIMGDGFGNGFDKLTTDAGEGWQIALALQAVVFLLSGFVLATIVS